jgi:hypothetical protein
VPGYFNLIMDVSRERLAMSDVTGDRLAALNDLYEGNKPRFKVYEYMANAFYRHAETIRQALQTQVGWRDIDLSYQDRCPKCYGSGVSDTSNGEGERDDCSYCYGGGGVHSAVEERARIFADNPSPKSPLYKHFVNVIYGGPTPPIPAPKTDGGVES